MSLKEKMTALADQVRTLRNTTDTLTIDEMTTGVTETNSEVAEQTDLIAQIQTALEGKAAGGVTLPELSNPGTASDMLSGKELIDQDGNIITGTIATKTSSDLTASGDTVTVPAGYYASQATKSVTTATQATPSISVDSAGLITASSTQSAGYVTAGTKSATKQLTTQAAKTITPSTSSQTAVAKDRYTTGVVTVAAIPSTYVKPTVNKAETTYTPTTSNQTIAAGTYCSGKQTIKGDANLVADNIKSGVSIFGVTGTYEGSGSGETAVETCNVNVKNAFNVYYTGLENGVISAKHLSSSYVTSFSITDCVCNTLLCAENNNISVNQTITTSLAVLLYQREDVKVFKITASSGQTATIKLDTPTGGGAAE